MPYPHEGLGGPMNNYIDDVREFLDSKHSGSYMVYNLAEKTYEEEKLHNRVSHVGWPSRRAPWLDSLLSILKAVDTYLKSDPNNKSVAVINCEDGKSCSATVVSAYSIYCGLFSTSEAALRLFAEKRYPSGYRGIIRASQRRYVDYVGQLVASPPYVPHTKKMKMSFITLTTIPMFNMNKTGCKPFIEVFERDTRVFSSASKTSLDQLRSYSQDDGVIQIPLNVTVYGDVIIIVYHVRGMPGARVIHKGTTAVKMFQFQFHTGFVDSSSAQLTLKRDELDGALRNRSKFPNPFQMILDIEFIQQDTQPSQYCVDEISRETVTPLPCFSTMNEQQKTLEVYGREDRVKETWSATSRQEYRDSPPQHHVKPSSQTATKETFFQSLDWQGSRSKQEEAPRDQAEVNLLGDDWDVDEDAGITEDIGSIDSSNESSVPSTSFKTDLFGMSPQQPQPPSNTELLVQFSDQGIYSMQSQQSTQAPQQAPAVLLDFGEVPSPTSHFSANIKHAASDSSLISKPSGDGGMSFFTANWPGIDSLHSSSAPGSREATASPATTYLESAQPAQGQKQSQPDFFGDLSFSSTNPFSKPGDLLAPSTTFDPFGPIASNDTQWMTDMTLISSLPQQTQTASQLQAPTAQSQPLGSMISPQQANVGVPTDHQKSRRSSFPDLVSATTTTTASNMPRIQTYSGQLAAPMAANFSAQVMNPSATATFGSASVSAPPSSPGSPTGTAPFDPFAEFGNLKPSTAQQNFKQTKPVSTQKTASVPAMTPRTQYTMAGFQQTTQTKTQPTQQPSKSTYTSVIGHREERGTRKPFGVAPAVQENAFGDILGSHGFTPARQKAPTSLNAIRGKSGDNDRDIDPETLRVNLET
jgi:cyclin G-associated kinase